MAGKKSISHHKKVLTYFDLTIIRKTLFNLNVQKTAVFIITSSREGDGGFNNLVVSFLMNKRIEQNLRFFVS
jgi:hypothetical protein